MKSYNMENPDHLNAEFHAGSDEVHASNENLSSGKCCDSEALMEPGCCDRHLETRQSKQYILTGTVDRKTHSEPCKVHENRFIKSFCVHHNTVGCTKCTLGEVFHETEEPADNHNGQYEQVEKKYKNECAKTFSLEQQVRDRDNRIEKLIIQLCEVKTLPRADSSKVGINHNGQFEQVEKKYKNECAKTFSLEQQVRDRDNRIEKLIIQLSEVKTLPRADSSKVGINRNGQFEQVEKKYKNECAQTLSLEQQVRDRDNRIEKLIIQLNEVKTLSRADSSKVGIYMTREGIKIMVYKSSILRVDVDCIASASSIHLHHGKGIAKIVADAAGKSLVEECKTYICSHGTLPVGQVCSTTAGQLKYKCVIHAHGPVWHDYDKNKSTDLKKCEEYLMETVLNSIYEAERQGMKSIAMPAISSATSGVPIEICVTQYVRAVQEYSSKKQGDLTSALSEIHFIDANKRTVCAIQDAFIKGIQPLGFKDK